MADMIIAADIGSGWSKFVGFLPNTPKEDLEAKIRGFHTAAGPAHTGLIQPGHKPVTVDFDGNTFFVGQTAEIGLAPTQRADTLSDSWAFEKANRAILYHIVALAAKENGLDLSSDEEINVHLISGLPQAFYQGNGERLAQTLMGSHKFKHCDQQMRVNFIQVDIVPQAMGAYYHGLYTMMSEDESEGRIGVIDIGTYTTDFCLAENVEYRAWASDGAAVGISDLKRTLKQILLKDFGSEFSDESIMKTFMTRQVLLRGSIIEVGDRVDDAIQSVASQLTAKIPASWDVDTMHLILAGGGAQPMFFGEWFTKSNKYQHTRVMKSNPFNAIVLGYAIYGFHRAQKSAE